MDSHKSSRFRSSCHPSTWIVLLVSSLILVSLTACSMGASAQSSTANSTQDAGASSISEALPATVSADQAYILYEAGAFVLDVRTQAEWGEGHIPGSVLIPLDQLANRLGEIPQDRDILVVCHSGGRSRAGQSALEKAGFKRVTSMSGGLSAWSAAGYPLEK